MDEIRNCHYCGGKPTQSTFRDINWIGEQGFKSTVKCESCGLIVERWAKTYLQAQQKAVKNWNGVYNDE